MPYMETPPRAPSESREVVGVGVTDTRSTIAPVSVTDRALDVANQFHANAPPPAGDIDLDFSVVFHDERYCYKVTIKLYEHGTENIVPWATPIPKVSVVYRTESGEIQSGESIQLEFVHNQEGYAAFFERALDFRWERFLFIGMQFDRETVKYYNVTDQEQLEERVVVEMRKVSLSTYRTYVDGDPQIWGRRFSGRGPFLFE